MYFFLESNKTRLSVLRYRLSRFFLGKGQAQRVADF